MRAAEIILMVHAFVCMLFVGFGLPLWRRRVPPNRWYGFRTPSTLRDERIWYPVNASTGFWMLVTGGVTFVVVLGTYFMKLPPDEAVVWNLFPLLTGIVVLVVRGWVLIAQFRDEQEMT